MFVEQGDGCSKGPQGEGVLGDLMVPFVGEEARWMVTNMYGLPVYAKNGKVMMDRFMRVYPEFVAIGRE